MNEPRDRAKVETTVPVVGVKATDSAFLRFVLWLDRLDERHLQPAFERALDGFDRVFGGGSGPYE